MSHVLSFLILLVLCIGCFWFAWKKLMGSETLMPKTAPSDATQKPGTYLRRPPNFWAAHLAWMGFGLLLAYLNLYSEQFIALLPSFIGRTILSSIVFIAFYSAIHRLSDLIFQKLVPPPEQPAFHAATKREIGKAMKPVNKKTIPIIIIIYLSCIGGFAALVLFALLMS